MGRVGGVLVSRVELSYSPSRYLLSYVPGGERGLKFMARICSSMCTSKSSSLVLPM